MKLILCVIDQRKRRDEDRDGRVKRREVKKLLSIAKDRETDGKDTTRQKRSEKGMRGKEKDGKRVGKTDEKRKKDERKKIKDTE